MPSETISTELNDIEKLEEEIKKRQKMLEKNESSISPGNQKDMELFFGEELAAKRKQDELKAKSEELASSRENMQKKEAELVGRERSVVEKEQYLQGREKSLGEFERGLTIKQNELNQRIEDFRKKDSEVRKMQEEFKKAMGEAELLKKEFEGRKENLRKSDELSAAEQRIASANQDLTLKETKIARMSEELDRKKATLQEMEKDFLERKTKIEDEERRLKIMKDGLETKAREFEDIFKEENDKLKLKADEIEKYVIGGARVRQKTELKPEPPKKPAFDEEAIRKEAIARVERKLASEKNSGAAKVDARPSLETKHESIEDGLAERKIVKQVQVKESPKAPTITPAVAPAATEENDIIAQERAMLAAATANKPADSSQACKTCEDLLKLVEKEKKIDAGAAAKTLCVREDEINKWASELKEKGVISLHQRFMGGTDLEMTRDAVKKLGERDEEEKIIRIKKELERIREEQKRMRGGF
jgi:hypothetical protein